MRWDIDGNSLVGSKRAHMHSLCSILSPVVSVEGLRRGWRNGGEIHVCKHHLPPPNDSQTATSRP